MRWLSTRLFRVVAVALCLLAVWLFQPWSSYPPFGKLSAFAPRVQPHALSDLDSILPHRMIASTDEGAPFPRREAPLDVFYDWDGERKSSERFIEEASVTGLFVLHDGAIAHERYRLGAAADDRRASFGMAEGVTALLLGAALEEGRIESVRDRVDAYAPRYAASPLGALTIETVLAVPQSEGAGETGKEPSEEPGRARDYFNVFVLGRNPDGVLIAQADAALEDAAQAQSGAEGEPDALAAAAPTALVAHQLDAAADARAQILAAVVRGAYEAPLAEVVETRLWGPLGMTDDASWSQHVEGERGVAAGACCLNATLRDYARLGALLNRDGVWDGTRLLPAGWAETVGVWNAPEEGGEVLLRGAYGQHLWVDRRRDVVIVLSAAAPDWRARGGETAAFLRAVAAAVVD